MEENMDKTVDQMGKMSNTTDKMSNTTDKMAKTTNDMRDTTCKMYTALRQGNSKVSRDTDIEKIEGAKDITTKLEVAAKYMQGMEYQVWAPSCEEVAPREIAIDQAAVEILTGVQPYAKNRGNVNSTKQSDDYETLYALGATLHRVNELQEFYLKGTEEKVMTPEDILVEGLRLNQARNRGTLDVAKTPIWATTVGKYATDATFLLRLRANFLMAYGYAVADSNDAGDAPKLLKKAWRLGTTKIGSKKWTPNLDGRDATEIRERITASLKYAKETRAKLVSLGIDPMTDQTMLKIWADADFTKIDLTKMDKGNGDDRARATAIRELIVARDTLITGGASGTW
jgi:hypothetical protein